MSNAQSFPTREEATRAQLAAGFIGPLGIWAMGLRPEDGNKYGQRLISAEVRAARWLVQFPLDGKLQARRYNGPTSMSGAIIIPASCFNAPPLDAPISPLRITTRRVELAPSIIQEAA